MSWLKNTSSRSSQRAGRRPRSEPCAAKQTHFWRSRRNLHRQRGALPIRNGPGRARGSASAGPQGVRLLQEHSSCHQLPMVFGADGVITTHWLRMGHLELAHLGIHHLMRTRGEVMLNAVHRHRLQRLHPYLDPGQPPLSGGGCPRRRRCLLGGQVKGNSGNSGGTMSIRQGGVRIARWPAAQAEDPGRAAP